MKRILSFSASMLLCGTLVSCQQKGGPLRVERVEPEQGVTGGGDQVVIKGAGFEPGKTQVEVRFGRQRAEQVSIASASEINVITPAGSKGPIDITLMFNNGEQFKIPQGFRYVAPGGGEDVRNAYFNSKPGANTKPAKPSAPPK